MIADSHGDTNRDFVFSKKAMEAMANYNKSEDLLKIGEIEVEYKRVPCDQENRNLAVRVEEASNRPYYLAIIILYQGGIMELDVNEEKLWSSMGRSRNAVRPTQIQYYHYAQRVLPSCWKSGVIYDTGIQIKDIAQEKCYRCDASIW
ncbi:Expansin-like A1 [Bienertia sinuspersici]